jgi:hypothetical protein
MTTRRIAAVMLGGLILAPLPTMAQSSNLAYATGQPRSEYMVFLDKGSELSTSAAMTIRMAARAAGRDTTIHLNGRAEHVQLVRQELIRDGIRPTAIFVTTDPPAPLARVNDGVGSPMDRKVDIKF